MAYPEAFSLFTLRERADLIWIRQNLISLPLDPDYREDTFTLEGEEREGVVAGGVRGVMVYKVKEAGSRPLYGLVSQQKIL
jgi:hypothetical protein